MRRYQHFYCHHCEARRRFRLQTADHWFHFKVAVLTVGIWALVWLAYHLRCRRHQWHCTLCFHSMREEAAGRKNAVVFPVAAAPGEMPAADAKKPEDPRTPRMSKHLMEKQEAPDDNSIGVGA